MKGFIEYINAVRAELTHVSWPSRGQAIAFTALVISLSLIVALVLGGFDFLFTRALEFIISTR